MRNRKMLSGSYGEKQQSASSMLPWGSEGDANLGFASGGGEQTPLSPKTCSGSESPGQQSIRKRACDFWQIGDSMRIMHHIDPKKYRAISLHGEVYQGFYNHDWHSVEHIHAVRNKCPANRATLERAIGPYPQDGTQRDHNRNRNYSRSHGSVKVTGGVLRNGAMLMVP